MKRITVLILFAFLSSFAFQSASQDKELTLQEVALKYTLIPQYYQQFVGMPQLKWRKNTDEYTYVKGDIMYEGKVKSSRDKELIDLETMNKVFEKEGYDKLKSFPTYHWFSEDEIWFTYKDQILVFNVKKKEVRVGNCCNSKADNVDVEPNTLAIAYTEDNNLFVSINPTGGFKVTDEEDANIVSGHYASRREFGITKGTFWSPDGNFLAFYQKDESKVSDYPVLDVNARVCENKPVKYPMAGMPSEEVKLGVFNMKTKETIYLETEAGKEQYLTNITWGPDEKYIYIAVLNRDQNHMKLNQYDAASGKFVKTLFEEKHSKYVEPEHGPYFMKTKPDQFVWFSERNNYSHLYLYNTDGEMISQVTDGQFDVLDFVGFDPEEKNVIYRAVDEELPLQKHIYSTNLETMEIVRLTTADGVHRAKLNDNATYFIDIHSSSKVPHQILIVDMTGMVVKTAYESVDPLKDYKLGEVSVGTVEADDGTPLYYRLIKPADFDPAKKYPVVLYVYGGPHSQQIENSWMYGAGLQGLWMQYMAQQGYIVFTLDNRGSPNRGLKFEQAVFRKLGQLEAKDQMAGINFLKEKSFVDAERIGVHGWSYGGYMTINLMQKYPETFKVGVSGAPVIDWSLYEVMYGERYMDTPEDNKKGYENSSLLKNVDKIEGDLLVIHGTSDETVVWQHTLKFLNACINQNVQVDYFVYPGQKHGIWGRARMHLMTKLSNYFMDNL